MSRFGWVRSPWSSSAPNKSLLPLEEEQQLEEALSAANLIMNDEVEHAETVLSKNNSPFHQVCFFLKRV